MRVMSEVDGDLSCPIRSLEKYKSKLNPKCDAFFQRRKVKFTPLSEVWYDNSPVGVNTFSGKLKKLPINAKCSETYTNPCMRATTVTTLDRAGIAHTYICAGTGHKRVESLKLYTAPPTIGKRHQMSNLLHNFWQAARTQLTPFGFTAALNKQHATSR